MARSGIGGTDPGVLSVSLIARYYGSKVEADMGVKVLLHDTAVATRLALATTGYLAHPKQRVYFNLHA